MKIQPHLRRYEPAYPIMIEAQQDPALLAHIPARWERRQALAAWFGILALSTQTNSVLAEDGIVVPIQSMSPEIQPSENKIDSQVKQVAAVVAPLLDEALANDGRGAFGCIAINPPSFLSEDEALELIQGELNAVGLRLVYGATLDGVPTPVDGMEAVDSFGEHPFENQPARLEPRKYSFDWADTNRAIYIEYLSQRDHGAWMKGPCSSVQSYDFPDVAQQAAEAFGRYQGDRPTYFGVFFDPLAHSGVISPPISGLTLAQEHLTKNESEKSRKAEGNTEAREKLRAQVRHFVEFLRKEGVVSTPE